MYGFSKFGRNRTQLTEARQEVQNAPVPGHRLSSLISEAVPIVMVSLTPRLFDLPEAIHVSAGWEI
jgi:hypothetical protein